MQGHPIYVLIDLRVKNDAILEDSAVACKRFICCTLTILYIRCSTVGQAPYVASISDLGMHIYFGTLCLSKYGALVISIGLGPPYHTIYSKQTYYYTYCKERGYNCPSELAAIHMFLSACCSIQCCVKVLIQTCHGEPK